LGRNVLANPSFALAQRIGMTVNNILTVPQSFTLYTADRWYLTTGANQQCSAVFQGPRTGYPGNSAYLSIYRLAGQTGVTPLVYAQPFDSDQVGSLQGDFVTLSFLVTSAIALTLTAQFFVGTGTPAKRGAGFTNESMILNSTVNLAAGVDTTSTFTSTAQVPANATQGELRFSWTPIGTSPGAGESVSFAEVQLEPGSSFSGFELRPLGVEWAICQRFYAKSFPAAQVPVANTGSPLGGVYFSQVASPGNAQYSPNVSLPVRMRRTPTYTLYNPNAANNQIRNVGAGSDWTASAAVGSESGFSVTGNTPSGSQTGQLANVHWTADAEI
jgi:hypothetical protein